jgi:hypothetical protein
MAVRNPEWRHGPRRIVPHAASHPVRCMGSTSSVKTQPSLPRSLAQKTPSCSAGLTYSPSFGQRAPKSFSRAAVSSILDFPYKQKDHILDMYENDFTAQWLPSMLRSSAGGRPSRPSAARCMIMPRRARAALCHSRPRGITRRRLYRDSRYKSEWGGISAFEPPSSDRALGEPEGTLHLVLAGPSDVHA